MPAVGLIAHPVQRYRLADVLAGLSPPEALAVPLTRWLTTRLRYEAPLSLPALDRLAAALRTTCERVRAGTLTVKESLALVALTAAAATTGPCARRSLRAYVRLVAPHTGVQGAMSVPRAFVSGASHRPVPAALHRLVRALADLHPEAACRTPAAAQAWLAGALIPVRPPLDGLYSTPRDDYASEDALLARLTALTREESLRLVVDAAFVRRLPVVPVWLTVVGIPRPLRALCLPPSLRRLAGGTPLGVRHEALESVARTPNLTPNAPCRRVNVLDLHVALPTALTLEAAGALEAALRRIEADVAVNPSLARLFRVTHAGRDLGLFLPASYVALPVPLWAEPLAAADCLSRPSAGSGVGLTEGAFVTRRVPGTNDTVTGVVLTAVATTATSEPDALRDARERAARRALWSALSLETLSARQRQTNARLTRREKLPDTLLRPALTPAALAALARALPEPDCAWLASLTLVELAHHTLRLRRAQVPLKGVPS